MNFLETMRGILREEGLAMPAELKRAHEHDDWTALQLTTEAVHQTVIPQSPVRAESMPFVTATAMDAYDSILAVKIGSSVVGDFWLCLSDTEPFAPGDGVPIYRPAEIQALNSKAYDPEALQAIHRIKVALEGTIQGANDQVDHDEKTV